jgi:hypothetical protein
VGSLRLISWYGWAGMPDCRQACSRRPYQIVDLTMRISVWPTPADAMLSP